MTGHPQRLNSAGKYEIRKTVKNKECRLYFVNSYLMGLNGTKSLRKALSKIKLL